MTEQDEFVPGYHSDENGDLINEIARLQLEMPDGRPGRIEVWSEGGCVFATFFLDAAGIEGFGEEELSGYVTPIARKQGVPEENLTDPGCTLVDGKKGSREWSVTYLLRDMEE